MPVMVIHNGERNDGGVMKARRESFQARRKSHNDDQKRAFCEFLFNVLIVAVDKIGPIKTAVIVQPSGKVGLIRSTFSVYATETVPGCFSAESPPKTKKKK